VTIACSSLDVDGGMRDGVEGTDDSPSSSRSMLAGGEGGGGPACASGAIVGLLLLVARECDGLWTKVLTEPGSSCTVSVLS
jgi:hypothetical protein